MRDHDVVASDGEQVRPAGSSESPDEMPGLRSADGTNDACSAAEAVQPIRLGLAVGSAPASPGAPALGAASPMLPARELPDKGPAYKEPPPAAQTPSRRAMYHGEAVADQSFPESEKSTVSLPLQEQGQQIGGHIVIGELARGGLGVVYLARHAMLDELRAIKRPLDHSTIDTQAMFARFRREVRAVGQLRNAHVIRAHDAGVDSQGPYLVMEYLDGEPLSGLVARLGPLPFPLACELIRQAAIGLQAAHERAMMHRDLKPSNLMLARDGVGARVVVIDWGLVKGVELSATPGMSSKWDVTEVGRTLGTPGYMSPEQLRADPQLDSRTDLFSLGISLGFLLTGRAPASWVDGITGVENRVGEAPRVAALRYLRPELPDGLLAIIGKMIDDLPARRFDRAGEVAEHLAAWAGNVSPATLLELLDTASPSGLSPLMQRWTSGQTSTAAGRTTTEPDRQPNRIESVPMAELVDPTKSRQATRGTAVPSQEIQSGGWQRPSLPLYLLLAGIPLVLSLLATMVGALLYFSLTRTTVPSTSPHGPNPHVSVDSPSPAESVADMEGMVVPDRSRTGDRSPPSSASGHAGNPAAPSSSAAPASEFARQSAKNSPADSTATAAATGRVNWTYVETFKTTPEGKLPPGWQGNAYAVQPDSNEKPTLVVVEPEGMPILVVPPPAPRADFDLELDYRLFGHDGAGYSGIREQQVLAIRLVQDASVLVRAEIQPDGAVVLGDRFPRKAATPPRGRSASARISRRREILSVSVQGLTTTALRLPSDFQVQRVELELTAGRVNRLNSDYARLDGVRLLPPATQAAPAALAQSAPSLSSLWLDERFTTTPLGDLPTGWLGPQFAVLHDAAGKPCLQVTAQEGQHELELPPLPWTTPWFVDVESQLIGHGGAAWSGVRQAHQLRFLLDGQDATTIETLVEFDGGVSFDGGAVRQASTPPVRPGRLGRPVHTQRARLEFTGDFLRVLIDGREANRLNRTSSWPRFHSLRLALTAGATTRISRDPAMIYRIVAGNLTAD